MRFWTQQLGVGLVGLALHGYLIWQWKVSQGTPNEVGVVVQPMIETLVGLIYSFVGFRATAWALWSPERSSKVLDHFRLTKANVIDGPFSSVLKWLLHLDAKGMDRDA
jgi:hypothetical protein